MAVNPEPLSQKHAFISYVHEDRARVDSLQEALEAAGVSVWRDTKDLWPGDDWEAKIRSAIKADALAFIACFSSNSNSRDKSYQNAELALAADEYRLRPPNNDWLLPVRFDECEVPDFTLGAGRTLGSIQRTDLFGSNEVVQTLRLVQTVQKIVVPASRAEPAIASSIVSQRAVDSTGESSDARIKRLLRDPDGDIVLDEMVREVSRDLTDKLNNTDEFPRSSSELSDDFSATKFYLAQVAKYNDVLQPALALALLASMYGLPKQSRIWTELVQTVAASTKARDGQNVLVGLREYPIWVLMMTAALGSIVKRNFETLNAFLSEPEIRIDGTPVPVAMHTGPRVVEGNLSWIASALVLVAETERTLDAELVEGLKRRSIGNRFTPISDYVYALLKPVFEPYFADEDEYAEAFDLAEIYIDLISADAKRERAKNFWGSRGGFGRYTWRFRHSDNPPEAKLEEAMTAAGNGWSPLLAGLFGGSQERAKGAFEDVKSAAQSFRNGQW